MFAEADPAVLQQNATYAEVPSTLVLFEKVDFEYELVDCL